MSLGGAFKALYLHVLIRSEALEGITSHSSALIHNIALISVSCYLPSHFALLSQFNTVALLEWHSFHTVYRQRAASTGTALPNICSQLHDCIIFEGNVTLQLSINHDVAFWTDC